MKQVQFVNGEVYHIFNRGVEKRDIFLDDKDYFRMVHDLFEFNDKNPAFNHSFSRFPNVAQFSEVRPLKIARREPRKLLVEILAWCLMPNHYHLLIRQLKDNGITEFTRKLGTGYTLYFNQKYERSGVLFEGRFKVRHVVDNYHFMHLPFYIHANALDLIEPGWREGKIGNLEKIKEFLKVFKWSSHLDYAGEKNFPSVSQREFILKLYQGEKEYFNSFQKWLKEMDMKKIKEVVLE